MAPESVLLLCWIGFTYLLSKRGWQDVFGISKSGLMWLVCPHGGSYSWALASAAKMQSMRRTLNNAVELTALVLVYEATAKNHYSFQAVYPHDDHIRGRHRHT